jgi:hypothetical protein
LTKIGHFDKKPIIGYDIYMRTIWNDIRKLISRGVVRISEHGYDELAEDGLTVREIIIGSSEAIVLEEYPDYPKGPCVLTLLKGQEGQPIHVVWGIPRGSSTPAVLITAYQPDPERWTDGFRRRRK